MIKNIRIVTIILVFIIVFIVSIKFFTKDNVSKSKIGKNEIINTYEEEYVVEKIQIKAVAEKTNKKHDSEEIQVKQEKNDKIEENNTEENNTEEKVISKEQISNTNINSKNENVIEEKKTSTVTSRSKSNQSTNKIKSNKEKKSNSQNNISTTYKGYKTIGKIEIPKTGVNLPILKKTSVGGMEVAPCFSYTTGKLNYNGKTLILGHNFKNGKLFSNNNKLKKGDKIYITTLDGKKVEYTIYKKYITDPSDVDYLYKGQTENPEIILSCCTNDEKNRIIIVAKANT